MLLGAEDSLATPVLGLLGVAITAAVAVATTWRWPTLRRRVQDHVALVKDLPEGYGAPLRELLQDELAEHARRERLVLDHAQWMLLQLALRVTLTAAVLVLGGAGVLALVGESRAAYLVLVIGGGLVVLGVLGIVLRAFAVMAQEDQRRPG